MSSGNAHQYGKCGRIWRAGTGCLVFGIAVLGAPLCGSAQQAPTYTVLHTFTGGADGANPKAYLIRDWEGNLYSTAFSGGDTGKCGAAGCGVVFKLDRNSKETVLYTFEAGTDGAGPAAGLLWDHGSLYSTTRGGGDLMCSEIGVPWQGCGVIFGVNTTTRNETTLYAFTGSTDGGGPSSGLIRDNAGSLYGTTVFGGVGTCSFLPGLFGCGVVYKIDPSGKETVLHAFTGGADGAAPSGNLFLDHAGEVLGAAGNGGDTSSAFCGNTILEVSPLAGCGTLFKIDPVNELDALYTFHGTDGGPFPIGYGWLIRDDEGSFYGMTGIGGDLNDCLGLGCGVVFKLDHSGKDIVLHRFSGGADGSAPSASVISDSEGNLYGTTAFGGDVTDPPCAAAMPLKGCGVVFKLDRHGHETVLHTFTGGGDGANPGANLLLDDGNLYGTAQYGGDTNCSVPGAPVPGCGVVFKIDLHRFER